MNRPLLVLLTTITTLVICGLLWPDEAAWLLPVVFAAFFALGTWGSISLRSGLWVRAVWRSRSGRPEVALTYDDGPDPESTPALLDLLDERGVRASFFCIGEKVRAHPELMKRMRDAGHVIGNHSERHSFWTNFYGTRRMIEEVRAGQAALRDVLGEEARYYRPPFGHVSHATAPTVRALELELVGWQVRGIDTPTSDPERVAQRVLRGLRPGGIVLLHDGARPAASVVAATAAILDGAESRGLRAVSLDELLAE